MRKSGGEKAGWENSWPANKKRKWLGETSDNGSTPAWQELSACEYTREGG